MLRLLERSSSSEKASSDGEVDSQASSDGEVDSQASSDGEVDCSESSLESYQFRNASDASDKDSSDSSSSENEHTETRSTESESTVETVDRSAAGNYVSVRLDCTKSSSLAGIEEDLSYSMSRYCADSEDHETPSFCDDIEVSDAGAEERDNVNKKRTLSNGSKCIT